MNNSLLVASLVMAGGSALGVVGGGLTLWIFIIFEVKRMEERERIAKMDRGLGGHRVSEVDSDSVQVDDGGDQTKESVSER
jgi:hypothetical protein